MIADHILLQVSIESMEDNQDVEKKNSTVRRPNLAKYQISPTHAFRL